MPTSSGTLHLKRYVTKHDANTSVMRLEHSNNVNFVDNCLCENISK